MKNLPKPLKIDKLVYNGYGLGYDKMAVFVAGALPGDVVTYKKTKKKRFSIFGEVFEVLEASPFRGEAPCSHFKFCGGCQIQQVPYDKQLILKKEMLMDCFNQQAFKHLASYCKEIIAAPTPFYYRNKMDFSFSKENEKIYLGLKQRARYDKIIHLKECHLQSSYSIKICKSSAEFFNSKKISVWDYQSHQGLLRHLTIRESKSTQNIMLIVTISEPYLELIKEFSCYICEKFPQINSIWMAVQSSAGDTQEGSSYHHISGKEHLRDHIGNVPFAISPNAFFQTNTDAATLLFQKAIELANPKSTDIVLDLYCGTGTIGLLFAKFVKKVIGIELNSKSIEDAKLNAQIQSIHNCQFYAGDVKDILKENPFAADILICDPPRSGLHPKALKQILNIQASKIVYISCHPMNMIRDLVILEKEYAVEVIQPMDMFPHTYHLECISILTKKDKIS